MDDEKILKLILVLCTISIDQDSRRLTKFVTTNSIYVTTEDFNKILRKSMKILEPRTCGRTSCCDWLVNELFKLYKIGT